MPVDNSWRNDPYTGGIPKHDYDAPTREYLRLFWGNAAQPDTAGKGKGKPKKCTCSFGRLFFLGCNCGARR